MIWVGDSHHENGRNGAGAERKAGPVDVAKAVFWSFLGIRRRAAHEQDAVTIRPTQVIAAGLIGALIFVFSLIALVRYITA